MTNDLTSVPESHSQEEVDDDTMELAVPDNKSAGGTTSKSTNNSSNDLEQEELGDDQVMTGDIVLLDETEVEALIDSGRTLPLQPLSEDTVVNLESKRIAQVMQKPPTIRAFQRCNIGFVRTRNEDSSFIFTCDTGGEEPLMPFGLYIVADGMGGHFAGHEASKSVSRMVAKHVLQRIYMPTIGNEGPSGPVEPIQDVMLDAIQAANKTIHSPDPEKDSGTTLTAALIFGRRLYITHVGDSRAYLFDNNKLSLITTDHSYVRRLQEAGQLTEEEAASHPNRNMLYMAVGQGGQLDVETFTRSLPSSGKLVLCSDGLWGLVTEQMIKDVLTKEKTSLQEMSNELIDLALKAGGYDNITIIIVDFSF
ncbi:MAG: protein phosphatase 2C domain-containing protein [Candidatus Promineifilaceae bacterium]